MDLDAIRKRLQNLQAKTSGNQYKWKPEPGETVVRIVPYQHKKAQEQTPFLELYFHYNLGRKTYLSPHTFGEPDPVLEFSEKLKKTGDKDDWILSKKLEPTLRAFAPVIVRGKEKEGVKFWGFGKEIYSELLKFLIDPDYGDITDLSTGRDITVEYKTPKEAGNTYGKVSIRVKPNQTKATTDQEVAKLIANEQPEIFDVFPKSTYEDLKEALQKWLDPESASTVSDEDIEKARQAANRDKEQESPSDENSDEKSSESKAEKEAPAESKETPAETSNESDSTAPDDINSQFEKLFANS